MPKQLVLCSIGVSSGNYRFFLVEMVVLSSNIGGQHGVTWRKKTCWFAEEFEIVNILNRTKRLP